MRHTNPPAKDTLLAVFVLLLTHWPANATTIAETITLFPEKDELIPTPTFFVFVLGKDRVSKAMSLSDGELYLSFQPVKSSPPSAPQVPLRISQRHHVSRRRVILELEPATPLTSGLRYELRAKPGDAEFIDMGLSKRTGRTWTVLSSDMARTPSWDAGAPVIDGYTIPPYFKPRRFEIHALLQKPKQPVSGFIGLGRDENGKILNRSSPFVRGPEHMALLVSWGSCMLHDLSWTHLHSFEVIPLGLRGERGTPIHIPARANRVLTSVLGSLARLNPRDGCQPEVR